MHCFNYREVAVACRRGGLCYIRLQHHMDCEVTWRASMMSPLVRFRMESHRPGRDSDDIIVFPDQIPSQPPMTEDTTTTSVTSEQGTTSSRSRTAMIVIIVVVVSLLACLLVFLLYRRYRRRVQAAKDKLMTEGKILD